MKDRIIQEFERLVSFDNPSLNERKVADHIVHRLKTMGFEPHEDDAAIKTGGNTGNIICKLPGDPKKDSLLFACHMDSVDPCENKKIILEDGYFKTDGTTVLGSDDLAGAAAMLYLAQEISSDQLDNGDVWLVFTIAEEVGLLGAKQLDLSNIQAKYGYVLDSNNDIGTVTISAPSHNTLSISIKGKAAHAGIEPEKGINAIKVASEAIHTLELGRIDEETTSNIGMIQGGKATNVVCEEVHIKGECRSRNPITLDRVTNEIKKAFINAGQQYGATVNIDVRLEYQAYEIDPNEPIILKFKDACRSINVPFTYEHSGGGSDTNIISAKGIQSVNISVGMENVHSVHEKISVDNLINMAKLLCAIVE